VNYGFKITKIARRIEIMEYRNKSYMGKLTIIGNCVDEDIIYCAQGSIPLAGFLNPAAYPRSTTLHFPSVSEKPEKRLMQRDSYEYFINTMADMIQKYTPEFDLEME